MVSPARAHSRSPRRCPTAQSDQIRSGLGHKQAPPAATDSAPDPTAEPAGLGAWQWMPFDEYAAWLLVRPRPVDVSNLRQHWQMERDAKPDLCQGDTMCILTAMAEGLNFDVCVVQMRQLLASVPSASAPAPSDGPSGSATTPSAPLSPELPSAPSEATLSAPMLPGAPRRCIHGVPDKDADRHELMMGFGPHVVPHGTRIKNQDELLS